MKRAKDFMDNAFKDGQLYNAGASFSKIVPPLSIFSEENERGQKREIVIDKFTEFFNNSYDVSNKL